jgi:hypothetical protein
MLGEVVCCCMKLKERDPPLPPDLPSSVNNCVGEGPCHAMSCRQLNMERSEKSTPIFRSCILGPNGSGSGKCEVGKSKLSSHFLCKALNPALLAKYIGLWALKRNVVELVLLRPLGESGLNRYVARGGALFR